jgi:uncharacterized membrane protein YfcA
MASMNDLLPLPLIAFVALVFVLAGFVKGVIGLGLPTLAMGLLGLVMAPAQAAALLVLPSLLTNVWQVLGPGLPALARRLATLLLGVCAGVGLGSGWLFAGGTAGARWAGIGLGLALAAYAGLGLLAWRPRVEPRHEGGLAPLVGLATGLVTAATGVFVIPAVPYLQALGLAKDDLVRALGLAFLVATLALAASLGHGGALRTPELLASLHAVLPALAGMALGQWLRGRLAPEPFRRCFLTGLLLLGGWLALRGLVQL